MRRRAAMRAVLPALPVAPLPLLLQVAPVPAPRQTGRDAFRPSPPVQRYRAFRDTVRLLLRGVTLPTTGLWITFALPMPLSWSARKRQQHLATPHRQAWPDVDNMAKALLDSVWPEGDGMVADIRITKIWATTGSILIDWLPEYRPPATEAPVCRIS